MQKISLPTIIIFVVFFITISSSEFSYAQTTNEIEWKNHTSPHHKLSLEYPADWVLEEGKESRFDGYKELTVNDYDPVTGKHLSFSVSNVDMPEGPIAKLEADKDSNDNRDADGIIQTKIIEDIQPYENKIDGEDAYSLLSAMTFGSDTEAGNAGLELTTFHNGQGFVFFFFTIPAKLFDDPKITEIREHMINSIKWND